MGNTKQYIKRLTTHVTQIKHHEYYYLSKLLNLIVTKNNVNFYFIVYLNRKRIDVTLKCIDCVNRFNSFFTHILFMCNE